MTRRGRPAKPGGEAVWIPAEIRSLVDALKSGDRATAAVLFGQWCAGENISPNTLDDQNKPNVN